MTKKSQHNTVDTFDLLPVGTERDCWFDNAKAFLILLVVIGHMSEDLVSGCHFTDGVPAWLSTLFKSIYVIHMPVFLIVSGRFAKNRIDKNDWVSVVNKLLVPYLVLQTVMMLFIGLTAFSSLSNFSYLSPLFGCWYIFTIMIYQFITPHLKKFKALFAISLVVAIGSQFAYGIPMGGFMRVLTYYPFFLFGYYSNNWDLSFCKKTWFRIISVMAFVTLFMFVWLKPHWFKAEALTLKRVYSVIATYFGDPTELKFLLLTLFRYAAGFTFFFFTLGISPTRKTFLSYTGQYSVYIYTLHLFVVVLIRTLEKKYGILDFFNTDFKAAIYILCSVPLSMFLSSAPVRKAMGWLSAPKFDLRKLIKQLTEDK